MGEHTQIFKEMAVAIQEQKNVCVAHTTKISIALENITSQVGDINAILTKGSNGKPLTVRVAVLEQSVERVTEHLKGIESKIDKQTELQQKLSGENRRAKYAFWGVVIAAFLTAAASLVHSIHTGS